MKRRRRAKLDRPEALEGILDRAGESRFAKRPAPIGTREWSDAVGARVASRALPVALERGVLTVKVCTSAWSQELSLLEPEVVAALQQRGHKVQKLRFRVGPLPVVERPVERTHYAQVPQAQALPEELALSLARVDDDALRNAIAEAASVNLAWQENFADAPATSVPRSARAPRAAGEGSVPPDRSDAPARGDD